MSGRHFVNKHGIHIHVGGRHRPKQTRDSHPHLFRGLRALTLPPAPDFDNTVAAKTAPRTSWRTTRWATAPRQALATSSTARRRTLGARPSSRQRRPSRSTANQRATFRATRAPTRAATRSRSASRGRPRATTARARMRSPAGHRSRTRSLPIRRSSRAWRTSSLSTSASSSPTAGRRSPAPASSGTWAIRPTPTMGTASSVSAATPRGIHRIGCTWGTFTGVITYAAIAQFCASAAGGNLFAILTPELINKAKGLAPNGLDYDQLLADFQQMGGNVALRPLRLLSRCRPAPRRSPTPRRRLPPAFRRATRSSRKGPTPSQTQLRIAGWPGPRSWKLAVTLALLAPDRLQLLHAGSVSAHRPANLRGTRRGRLSCERRLGARRRLPPSARAESAQGVDELPRWRGYGRWVRRAVQQVILPVIWAFVGVFALVGVLAAAHR